MEKSKNGWSERRRKQQACNARRNKPWEKSTGPRTPAGKATSSMNAYKHGTRSAAYAAIAGLVRLNKEFLSHAALLLAYELQRDAIMAARAAGKRTEGKLNKNKGAPPPPPHFPPNEVMEGRSGKI